MRGRVAPISTYGRDRNAEALLTISVRSALARWLTLRTRARIDRGRSYGRGGGRARRRSAGGSGARVLLDGGLRVDDGRSDGRRDDRCGNRWRRRLGRRDR